MLGIETSCDDTGVAIYDDNRGLLAHTLHSQSVHAEYGGVVPELASRDHIRTVIPLLNDVFAQAKLTTSSLDAIAYTSGPGLIGALMSGAATARSLAWSLRIPSLGVHHMEGHLLAPMLEPDPPEFPFIALLVSGGHTLLAMVQGLGDYKIIGQSLDDAVGEAFDKTAKLLGLAYPGGPALAKLALQGKPGRFMFPRPMTDRPGLDFSFSGLKTFARNSLLKAIKESLDPEQTRADIALAFEEAVVETLLLKCKRALKQTALNTIVVAGGVGANQSLRVALQELSRKENIKLHFPRVEFCTDNGAMIAYAGCLRLKAGEKDALMFNPRARWPIDELGKPS